MLPSYKLFFKCVNNDTSVVCKNSAMLAIVLKKYIDLFQILINHYTFMKQRDTCILGV